MTHPCFPTREQRLRDIAANLICAYGKPPTVLEMMEALQTAKRKVREEVRSDEFQTTATDDTPAL